MWIIIENSESDPLAVWALVIGGVGLLVAAGTLFWQYRMFRLSGSRVEVDFVLVESLEGAEDIEIGVGSRVGAEAYEILETHGYQHKEVQIRVRSTGRISTTVTRISFRTSVGIAVTPIFVEPTPTLPKKLGHDESETWIVEPGFVSRFSDVMKPVETKGGISYWAEVLLANGRVFRSKNEHQFIRVGNKIISTPMFTYD